MIFSFEDDVHQCTLPVLEQTDIFCFFSVPQAVLAPKDKWYELVLTSLYSKRNVLILEKNFSHLGPIHFHLRFQVFPHYLWIHPRALGFLKSNFGASHPDYSDLRQLLSTSK